MMPAARLLRRLCAVLFPLAAISCTDNPAGLAQPAELPLLLVVIPDFQTSPQSDLYTLSPAGTSLHRLTNTPMSEMSPAWSPNGTRIAYQLVPASGLRTQGEIHVMNADGTGDRRLAGPGDLGPPAWSPDGARIAFDQALFPDSSQRALLVMQSDGTGLDTILNRRAVDGAPVWSPDGARLAFTSNCLTNTPACWVTTLWTVRLADTTLLQLTFFDPVDSLGQDDAGAPQWSPDGSMLAIQHGGSSTVALLPSTGGPLVPVNTGTAEAWSPAWSPSGLEVAFVAGPPAGPAVWIAERDGTRPRPLASIPGILRTLHWQP